MPPGSLMMLDANEHPTAASREWFYKGNGVWMVGVASESAPDEGTLSISRRRAA